MAGIKFSEVEKRLGEALSRLKSTKEPEARRALLRKMRVLLADAQEILDSETA
jgi:hypothetical protein